jgi:hypothetical protein
LAKNSQKKTVVSEREVELATHVDHQIQESKWNRIEYFIVKTQSDLQQNSPNLPNFFQAVEGMYWIQIKENQYICFEAKTSLLEKHIFHTYLLQQLPICKSEQDVIRLFESQNLIESTSLAYALITAVNEGFEIQGNNGLLVQGKEKLMFLTNVPVVLSESFLIVSNQLKEELIATEQWDGFLNQIELLENTTNEMKIKTLRQSWSTLLKAKSMGMAIVFK